MIIDQQVILRQTLIDTACQMGQSGINCGTAGNLSVRTEEGGKKGFLITPSGLDYASLTPEDIVFMGLDGGFSSSRKPSSEWRFHRDIYVDRPEAGAVLHAHSPFATSIACLRRDIPAFNYMIARFGGKSIRCASYALFGSQELSDAALVAMKDRNAALLSNHGMLVFGKTLRQALDLGLELEMLCEQYWRACLLGSPVLLTDQQMEVVLEKFADYGQLKK